MPPICRYQIGSSGEQLRAAILGNTTDTQSQSQASNVANIVSAPESFESDVHLLLVFGAVSV